MSTVNTNPSTPVEPPQSQQQQQHSTSAASIASSVSRRRPDNVTPLHSEVLGEAHTTQFSTQHQPQQQQQQYQQPQPSPSMLGAAGNSFYQHTHNQRQTGSATTTTTTSTATNVTTTTPKIQNRLTATPIFSPHMSTALAMPSGSSFTVPCLAGNGSFLSTTVASSRGGDEGSHASTPSSGIISAAAPPFLNGTPNKSNPSSLYHRTPNALRTDVHHRISSAPGLSLSEANFSPSHDERCGSTTQPPGGMHSWTHSITTPHLQPCSHGSVPATSFFNSSITLIPTAVKTLMMPNASGRVGDIAPDIAAGASCGRRSLTHSAIYRPSSCAPIHIGGGGGSVTPYAHRNSLMSPAGGRCSITAPPPPPKIVRLDDTVPTFVEQPGDLTMALDRVTRVSDEQNKELLAKIAALHALMVSLISIVSEANAANINAIEQQQQELVPPTRSGSALSLRSSSHDVSNNNNNINPNNNINNNNNNNNNISVENDEVVTNTTGLEKLSMPEAPMILYCPPLHKSRRNISSTTSSSSSTQYDGGLIRHALRKLVTYLCEMLVAWIMRMRASAASIQPHYTNASSTTSVELCGLSAARSWFLQLVTQF